MASPNAVFTELVTTTFRKHRKTLKDNVTRNNALLAWLERSGKMTTADGGLTIAEPIEYAENSTYQRYSGFDVLNVQQSEVFTAVEFPWRQTAIHVVASGRELRINSGDSQIIKLAKARLTNAMHTWDNNFSVDAYSDGTLANQVNGLQAMVSDTGTGTIGGIDSTAYPFWRNKVQSAAAPLQGGGAITPSASTIESLMLPLWLELVRGNDQPDLIVCSNDYYTFFEQSQTSIKRYTNATEANAGFVSLKYKKADVIFDGNSGIPNSRMYFLNTKYIYCVAHRDADLTVQDEIRPYNQDGVVIPILWMGNFVITNRALQGVLKP